MIIISDDKQIAGRALWDTGATSTCISEAVVQNLGLKVTGMMDIRTPSGTKTVNTFSVNIGLPNHLNVADVRVCETDIGNQGIEALIGMDIISLGDFCVSNYDGKTVFSFRFPSKEATDYVPQSNIDNIIGTTHGKGLKKRRRK